MQVFLIICLLVIQKRKFKQKPLKENNPLLLWLRTKMIHEVLGYETCIQAIKEKLYQFE